MAMSVATQTMIVAQHCKDRAEALGYKGKKRDDFAVDFFIGALAAATASGQEEFKNHLGTIAMLIVATRGYAGVLDLLNPRPTFKAA